MLIGGKFYFDWLLFTNPVSKNPLWKWFCKWAAIHQWYGPLYRLDSAYRLFNIHLALFGWYYLADNAFSPWNILTNLYPMLVQVYIGGRCFKICQKQNQKRYPIIFA